MRILVQADQEPDQYPCSSHVKLPVGPAGTPLFAGIGILFFQEVSLIVGVVGQF